MDCGTYENDSGVPATHVRLLSIMGNDSHAEPGASMSGDYAVTCNSSLSPLDYGCSGNYVDVVQLAKLTDSHVSVDGTYANSLCFNMSAPYGITHNISATGATPANYECVFAVANKSNSHVYECDHSDADYNVNLQASIPPYTGCVDLENESTYQGKVYNWSAGASWYGYWINANVSLCQKDYMTRAVSTGENAALVVNKSDIVVDCNSAVFFGPATKNGINVVDQRNVTLTDCTVRNYSYGFSLNNVNYSLFSNIRAWNNSYGMAITDLSYDNFVDFWIYNNTWEGVRSNRGVGVNYTRVNIVNHSVWGFGDWSIPGGVNMTWRDSTICSNAAKSLYLRASNYSTFYNNTICDSSTGLQFDRSSAYNNITGNTFYGNYYAIEEQGISAGICGYSCNGTIFNNTFINNTVGYRLRGTYMNLSHNRIFNNTYGVYAYAGGTGFTDYLDRNEFANNSIGVYLLPLLNDILLNLSGNHYYSNANDLVIGRGSSGTVVASMANDIFDNPAGNYQDFTNLSLYDSMTSAANYTVNWTSNTAPLPAGRTRFLERFVSITPWSGSVSVEKIAWRWTDAEAVGHDENQLQLYKWNSTIGWLALNTSPDTVNNELSLSNIVPASDYGILETAINYLLPAHELLRRAE
jgi:hypothetical protein